MADIRAYRVQQAALVPCLATANPIGLRRSWNGHEWAIGLTSYSKSTAQPTSGESAATSRKSNESGNRSSGLFHPIPRSKLPSYLHPSSDYPESGERG